MSIDEVIRATEDYIASDISEHNRELALMILQELKKIEADDKYVVPRSVTRSLLDSFSYSSDYWKNYFTKFWDEHFDRFEKLR